MKAIWDDDVIEEGSDSEVEEIANVVCLVANDSIEVHSDSDSSYCFDYDTGSDSKGGSSGPSVEARATCRYSSASVGNKGNTVVDQAGAARAAGLPLTDYEISYLLG
ncbi:hypothetical protein LIER_07484 [Lithospermum erythrorhizon]|uniref:Uncharacterized protein n=1 Tax=Lithospermum erythrorhizon TaxID=34254 RepID=A0AAV3P8G4_LITER